jgi:hypothetical protein
MVTVDETDSRGTVVEVARAGNGWRRPAYEIRGYPGV